MTVRKAKAPTVSAAQKELAKNNFPAQFILSYCDEEAAKDVNLWSKVSDANYTEPGQNLDDLIQELVADGDKYIVVYAPLKIVKVTNVIKETLV